MGANDKPAVQRRPALTRLRVLLIGWVLVYHLELPLRALRGLGFLEGVALKGYLGVDGFFLLSGFALVLGYAHRPPEGFAGWRMFMRGRLARVLPLHWALLLAMVAMVLAAMAAGLAVNAPERFGLRDFVLQALLLHGWETTSQFAWNYPSWALSVILAGYIAFPPLLAGVVAAPVALLWLLAGIAAMGLLALGAMDPGLQLNHTLHLGLARFFLEFIAGMVLARLVQAGAVARWAATLGVGLVPAGLWLGIDAVVVAGLASLVVRAALQEGQDERGVIHRLGEASFGVYLAWVFVESVLVLVLRLVQPGLAGRLLLMAAGLGGTFLAGWIAWRIIEVPAARWLAGRGSARRA
ncbi:acyltransferase family protein [Falsiroseomonas ponticola]|uniref:acyltransferase family protein n=1 Tax=Falsiroseomonas ponticola TaxID=2786951 RepID=UPI001934781C|nr:acyltransferase [Roseomonas ponticola]